MLLTCTPKDLPTHLRLDAARTAVGINPANAPNTKKINALARALSAAERTVTAEHLAIVTDTYWGSAGVKLSVQFLTPVSTGVRDRILAHMNAWQQYANVNFVWTQQQGQVRIAFAADGYWSYVGTDILHIPANQPTMNLQGFDSETSPPPESEWHRVVRHETGHTLGCPHEHMRLEIVRKLDPNKTIAWGAQVLGWDANMVTQQILTPIDENSLRATTHADQDSIMCYQLPGSITVDGQPIPGGTDIDAIDQQFIASQYPPAGPPPPPPPQASHGTIDILQNLPPGSSIFQGLRGILRIRAGNTPITRGSYKLTSPSGAQEGLFLDRFTQLWLLIEQSIKSVGPLAKPLIELMINNSPGLSPEDKSALTELVELLLKQRA